MRGNGCYAESGPTAIHWRGLPTNPRGLDLDGLLSRIRGLPRNQIWRYGTAGDLPPEHDAVRAIAAASAKRPVIVYTHRHDPDWIEMLRSLSMHVNLSADDLDEADRLAETGLSVVVVLRSDQTEGPYRTPAGRKVAVCPATRQSPKTGSVLTTCALCQVCAKPRPGGVIIGFPAHGARKKVVDRRLQS